MLKKLFLFSLVFTLILLGCEETEAPPEENEEEVIDQVTLTFAGSAGNVTAVAEDTDGDGIIDRQDTIILMAQTAYTLGVEFRNTQEGEDITEEIEEEDEEHALFFGFTENIFSDPQGSGNLSGSGTVNYQDMDANGLPVGLSTSWTTGDAGNGQFTVVLKHQPDIKSSTSTAEDGETDVQVAFPLVIQ